jgi:anaerobic ribonucleoside-triphosphate reductase activating protein
MRIAGVSKDSVVDGPGLRQVIFFQGCPHHCNGCHNPDTWDPSRGQEVSLEWVKKTIQDYPGDVTFSGGDPLMQAKALSECVLFALQIKKNVVIYTGYTWEKITEMIVANAYLRLAVAYSDLIVDGPFIEAKKTLSLPFRGSSNQRLIRPHRSLIEGQVIEWDPEREEFIDGTEKDPL